MKCKMRCQEAIIGIVLAAVMLALVLAAMIGSTGAYSEGGPYNIIEKYMGLKEQKVLIGQDNDKVDLVVIGLDGQIKYYAINDQQFTDITVDYLTSHYGNNNLDTTGWSIGDYTFRIRTKPEYACGLEAESEDVAILLTPELTAYLSVPAVAVEDDFTVFGTAQGQMEVVILSVPPKGGGGKSLLDKGDKGLSPRKASVSMTDDTYSKKMTVQEDATAGYYDIYVLCAGMDGEWGMTGQEDLEAALDERYGIPSLTEGVITTKTQAEIEDILEDLVTTPGSDDLMVELRLKVETAYVKLDPVADVTVGEPLVVTGTSNRQEGYVIVVTCKGPVELAPHTVKVENGTFGCVFDTTDNRCSARYVHSDSRRWRRAYR